MFAEGDRVRRSSRYLTIFGLTLDDSHREAGTVVGVRRLAGSVYLNVHWDGDDRPYLVRDDHVHKLEVR